MNKNTKELLTDEDFVKIHSEYRRQKMLEGLLGPCVSTAVHIIVFLLLFMFAVGHVSQKDKISVELTPVMDTPEIPQPEPLPPAPEPEPPTPEPTETIDPVESQIDNTDIVEELSIDDNPNDEPPSTDDNAAEANISEIKNSAAITNSISDFGGSRSQGMRNLLSQKYNCRPASSDALMKALFWLQKVQRPNGSWGTGHQDGLTGLALLVYLAHGELPTSKNFGNTVSKAIHYLATNPITKSQSNGYGHAIKTYALAEAYTMTGNYILVEPLQQSAAIIINNQLDNGSFSYKYEKQSERWDMSIAGWNFQALKALSHSGLEVDGLQAANQLSIHRLKQQALQGFPYGPKAKGGKHSLLGVGTLCLQLFDSAKDFKPTDKIMDTIRDDALPKFDWLNAPKNALYSWYYSTYAIFQHGGNHWKAWNNKFQTELTKNQNPEGYWEYPGHYHGETNDDLTNKVHATVFSCLILEVFYRYLPSSSTNANPIKAGKHVKPALDEEEIEIFI